MSPDPPKCPRCGYRFEGQQVVGKDNATPNPGDFSVCLSCGFLSVFTDPVNVRPALQEDIDSLDQETRAFMRRIEQHRRWVMGPERRVKLAG